MRSRSNTAAWVTRQSCLRCEPLESRQMLAVDLGVRPIAPGVLTVFGDQDPTNLNDTIVVQPVAGDASAIEVVVNGLVTEQRFLRGLQRIVIAGGLGDDTIRIDVPHLRVGCTIRGGEGNDTIVGGPRGDLIHGGEGHDTIDGGDGNDAIIGGPGNDYLRGGRGADRINGGEGDDTIFGGLGNDALVGGEGNDTIDGESGVDVLNGGGGDDTLLGGTGRDRLVAGSGRDRLFGIVGRDRFLHDRLDRVFESELANPIVAAASDGEIRQWLLGQATRWHHETVFGSMARGVGWPESSASDGGGRGPELGATDGDGSTATGGTTNALGYSSTNTQVAGVDEADRVRTDGQSIYLLGEGELLVIDADPTNPTVVSRTPIDGFGSLLYLHGSRITVLSQVSTWSWPLVGEDTDPSVGGGLEQPSDESAGDVGVMPGIWPPDAGEQAVQVTVIDVTDRANPLVIEEIRIDGTLSASRSIGDTVTLVIENRPPFVSHAGGFATGPSSGGAVSLPGSVSVSVPGGGGRLPEPDDFRAELMSVDLATLLPKARSTSAAGEVSQPLVTAGSLYLPVRGGGSDLLSIVSFTPTDASPGIDHSVSTLGVASTVYASLDAIILAAADHGSWWGTSQGSTTLHAFSLAGEMPYLAGGSVSGVVLDQFAIDAPADGSVRIVTQTGWGQDSSTNLFVLARDRGDYVTIGSVTGLAPGETAMSARFVGDTAYVVTFEQVDPLFVIDLSEPGRPTVTGELVIPGFSSYLHPVVGTHLIGVGRSGDLTGVKLSLFDVSTPSQPQESAFVEFVAAEGFALSPAEWDHHAFSYFADRGLLAIPLVQWTWDSQVFDEAWAGISESWAGLVVLSVDLAAGSLRELARIEHETLVGRSLRIGGHLYSISETSLKVVDLADPATVVGTLPLAPAA